MLKSHFVPTGKQEEVIKAVGDTNNKTTIVNFNEGCKGGKTTIGLAIAKNIIWEHDQLYFDYPNFREWPFKDNTGNIIKRMRIVSHSSNIQDEGPIRNIIKQLWPKGRYTENKAGKPYYSTYQTDTGWLIDVMSYNQHVSKFEGPLISFYLIDDILEPKLIKTFINKAILGGILLFTQKPIFDPSQYCKKLGYPVKEITATIDDNSTTKGKQNTKGTKKGLLTEDEIELFKKTCSPDEYGARILGKAEILH